MEEKAKINVGMYIIDKNYHILYFNQVAKDAYPELKAGDICYKTLGCLDSPCPYCPIYYPRETEKIFYNGIRKEWIKAEIAEMELPEHGLCYSIHFKMKKLEECTDFKLEADSQMFDVLMTAFGNMPGGYHRCSTEEGFPFTYISDRFAQMLGWTKEEIMTLLDNKYVNLVHPDDFHFVQNYVNMARSVGRGNMYDERIYRLRCKQGYRWFIDTTMLVDLGEDSFFQGTIADVTEFVETEARQRVLLQRALKKTEESAEREKNSNMAIINALTEDFNTVIMVDKATGMAMPLRMNRHIDVIYGARYDKEPFKDIFQEYLDTIVEKDDRYLLARVCDYDYLEKNIQVKLSVQYRTHWRMQCDYHRLTVSKIIDKGVVRGFVYGFVNITESYMKEQRNREYYYILEKMADMYSAIHILDLQDETIAAYVLTDESLKKMGTRMYKKYPYQKVLRQYMLDNVKEEYHDEFCKIIDIPTLIRMLRDNNGSFKMDYEAWCNNEIHYMRSIISAIYEGSKIVSVVMGYTIYDEEVRQQQVLTEALRTAEAASQSKTNFLFNISHDIRTPMNAILGFSAVAEKYVDNRERVLDSLKKLNLAGEHLLRLINDVLNMARIESGQIKMNLQAYHIPTVIASKRPIFSAEIKKKKLNFIVRTDIKDEIAFFDLLRMEQIELNLISNAIKYTPEGGTVSYAVRQLASENGYAVYQGKVKDTGIGMSKEFCRYAFEAFEREKSSTVTGIQGTGLGLAITKNLLAIMGGSISCQSELGVGTEFTFTVRFKIGTEADIAQENVILDCKPDFKGKRILLVEDNELNREIACELLKSMGFELDIAEDGAVAVDKVINSGDYDLILMDVQMPNMDGYTATQKIRGLADLKLANIPIIGVTANAFENDREKALASGMDDYLAKPIDFAKLLKIFQSIL